MRTKSAQAAAILLNPSHNARAVVWVADSGGTLREIGATIAGDTDTIVIVDITENVDAARTARFTLQRQLGLYSRSPFVVSGANPLQVSAPSIMVGREVKIEAIVTPPDTHSELPSTRLEIFRGYVDQVNWPTDVMEVVCVDQSAKLRDTWIERERSYAFCTGANATRGAFVWDCDHPSAVIPYVVGDLVLPSKLRLNGHFYKVTAASSAQAVTEPTWPTGSGATVVSGGVTFTEAGATSTVGVSVQTVMQQILTDNGMSFTLQTPVSPGWTIYPFVQSRMAVADAIKVFADQLGWRCCFVWNSGSSAYLLTLYAPDRTRVTVDKALAVDDEVECTDLSVDIWSIRNVVQVIYGSSANYDPSGHPTRITRSVTDATSIAKYGRRFMEIAESDSANIDTAAEADTLANACLSDLKEPTAAIALKFHSDPFIEIGDMVQVPADGRRFDSTQLLATSELTHNFSAEGAKTSVKLQGKPVAMTSGWLKKDGRAKSGDIHLTTLFDSTGPSVIAQPVVGGQTLTIDPGTGLGGKQFGRHTEVHISTTPAFTPSPSTKTPVGETGGTIAHLVPGKVYYTKHVPYISNGEQKVRGSPSIETSFTAGRAKAGHYDAGSTPGILPLNGNFEHASDDLALAPFDHWFVFDAAGGLDTKQTLWTTSGGPESVTWGNDAARGNFVLLRPGAGPARGAIRTSIFPVPRNTSDVALSMSMKRSGTSSAANEALWVKVEWFQTAGGSVVATTTRQILADSTALIDTSWNQYDIGLNFTGLVDTYNFMRVGFYRGNAAVADAFGTIEWSISDVSLEFQVARKWIAPALLNGWANFGAPDAPVGYMKDRNGIVHVRGALYRPATGSPTLVMFNLPVGFRPVSRVYVNFSAYGADRWCSLYIENTGNFGMYAYDSTIPESFVDIGEIVFDTR